MVVIEHLRGADIARARDGAKDSDPLKNVMRHKVGFYLCPGFQILDLAGPLAAFQAANQLVGKPLYDWQILSRSGGVVQGSVEVPIATAPVRDVTLDTLLIVGGEIKPMRKLAEVQAVKHLAGDARRVASVCTGAFLLAEAGLLNARRATTHWRYARELQHRYPAVKVEADRIFVTDDQIWTSAGVTAGIDLALALIEADQGTEVARSVARDLVVYHRRPGGQSQFAPLSQMEPESDRIRIALTFARDHLPEPLPVERLAEAARLSVRQFGRAFRRETGETPAKAVERLRVEAARIRLQDGLEPIELIARAVGFNDPERMRRAFINVHGRPPQALRRDQGRSITPDPGLSASNRVDAPSGASRVLDA